MSPRDKNILDALHLLVLLYRSKKNPILKVPEEERAKLFITEENLQQSGMTIPVFLNALDDLSSKGYVYFVSPFAKKAREEIAKYQKSEDAHKALAELAKKDTKKVTVEMKEAVVKDIQRIAPKDMFLDVEGLLGDSELTFENLVREAHEHVLKMEPDTVASVFVLPFRDIERLYKKMGSGIKFDDVQDEGIWYDAELREFHFEGAVMSTADRGRPTVAHYVLDALFNRDSEDMVVDFSDVATFDDFRGRKTSPKRYSDGMRHFVSKNPVIAELFEIYSDRIGIAPKYRTDVH